MTELETLLEWLAARRGHIGFLTHRPDGKVGGPDEELVVEVYLIYSPIRVFGPDLTSALKAARDLWEARQR